MTILSVQNLTKTYGKNVLDNVSLRVEEPSLIGLVGPNGAGKSTFLNCITHILDYQKGKIEVFGLSNRNPKIFERTSYMMDNARLYPYLTGFDHMQYVADTHRLKRTRLRESLEILGIGRFVSEKVGSYSLGMKQQLLITMALLPDPDLLIMGEPFNGLDPTTTIRLRELLIDRFRAGKSVLLSSHNLSEIDRMTGHIVFVKGETAGRRHLRLPRTPVHGRGRQPVSRPGKASSRIRSDRRHSLPKHRRRISQKSAADRLRNANQKHPPDQSRCRTPLPGAVGEEASRGEKAV